MNRAPITNGHSPAAALTTGGYDAYFAQVEQSSDDTAANGGTGAAVSRPVEYGSPPAAGAQPPQETMATRSRQETTPPVPETGAPQYDERGSATVSAPDPGNWPAAGVPAAPSMSTGEAVNPAPSTGEAAQRNAQSAPVPGPAPTQVNPPTRADPAGYPTSARQGPAAHGESAVAQPNNSPSQASGPSTYHYPNATGSHPMPNTAASRVPDRITRTSYDTPRVEVLPPALASPQMLADIAAVRQAHLRSAAGVRGALNKVGFNFGLSPAEQRAEDRRNRIRRQLTAPYQIAVLSVKGGVGRTTTAATLGSVFAKLRPDRVAAVDANPDFGDLATRTARHPYGLTLRDLAQSTQHLDSFSAVHAYTSVNTADLAVIASPWSTDASQALTGEEYGIGVEVLRRHYNLLVVDCGTGVLDSATDAVLRTSDAVVVVTPATVGGVTGAVATLNWLSSHGFDHLIATSVVAIVQQHPIKPTVEVSAIEKLFATAQRPTCQIPFDPHLAEGGEIDLRLLDKETQLAFEELAAGLADDFPGYPTGPSDHGGRL
ncbi:MinD/ParA family ATP-binding protein [Nocardia brevicatena]|uniref:MinD/ParA family ATP-binding protein n=1 Tax=Nocardia brevicatena TaxID=37327 RepID=UPI0003177983|nr:MinD/ParA family protein [Nocardia brevicatena]